jgi:uncharacterized repeat protein (TIGR01451 family)
MKIVARNKMLMGKSALRIFGALSLCAAMELSALALDFNLEGLDRNNSTNWTPNSAWSSVNLQDWRELDFIPVRIEVQGGPAVSQLLTITFPHYSGGVYGFQNLYFISNSPNVSFSSAPVLNANPASSDWSYDLRVTVTGNQRGYVYFYARLAAGAHLNPGSSLHLEGPALSPLQIHKPRPGPGSPDLAIKKTGPATAGPGDIITYSISYTNKASGTNNAAHGVQIIDSLAALVTFVSASDGGTMAGNTLSFDIRDLTNRASGFVTYQVRVASSAVSGQMFTNNALIVSSEDDANMSDNRSSVKTTVIANRPPVANPDAYTTSEDAALVTDAPGVLANDSDPDGNAITAQLVSTTANGTLTLNANGSFNYTPNPNFSGLDGFTYRATDGSNFSSVVSATITVAPINDPPVAVNDSYTTPSDSTLTIGAPGVLANDTDVENDPLNAILANPPAHGALTLNANGSFTYAPNANFSGSDSFSYRASDGGATSGVATVSISVVPLPVIIVIPPVNQTNCPGETAVFNVTATGTALTYQWLHGTNILSGATNRTLVLTNVALSTAGSYCVIVDGAAGGPVTHCASLFVNQNVFVVTPPISRTNCPNTTVLFTVNATGTALQYQWFFQNALLAGKTNATLVVSNVMAANAGAYAIVVSGRCGQPVTNSATLTVNQAPAIVTPPSSQTSFVGSNVVFSIGATGTGLSYRWIFNGSLVGTNNTLALNNLAPNQAGTYCVIVSGTCGSSMTNCTTLTIQNRAPTARDDSYTTAEDTTLTISGPGVLANDFDVDGDALTAIIVSNPANGSLSLNSNGGFVYRPNTNYNGMDTFTYRAMDGGLASDVATVTLTVAPVNDAPVARDDSYVTAEDTTLTIAPAGVLANDLDADGHALTALLVSNAAHGTLTLNPAGGFVYRPNTNYNGTDTFTYRATDGGLASAVATVTLTITPVNDRPTPGAAGDNYSVLEDQTLTVPAPGVLGNDSDIDGDSLVAVFISGPAHGAVTLNANGSFVYVPSANYFGADSFIYVASDGRTSSVPAVVNITVTPVNDAPSFTGGGDQKANQNSPLQTVNWASNISAGPANESGQTTLFWVSNDNPSLFALVPAIAPDGKLRYRPATNAFGVATVRVTLRDDGGTANGGVDSSSEVVFSITINSPPAVSIISPLDGTVLINPATFSVLADASDPDGTVTNVLFTVNGAAFTNVAQPPFYFVMTNAAPGSYQLRAVAADDCGLLATSAVVNVSVVTNTVVAFGPLVLNHQNGLFEQFVTISNATSETWLNGVRLFVLNLDSTNRVYNFTGTNANGTPFLDAPSPVPPGGLLTMVVQYYVPNPRSVPNPALVATPLAFAKSVAPKIMHVEPASDGTLHVHFTSQQGRFYFLQYSDDLTRWTTDPIRMIGSGPLTIVPAHKAGTKCFYRVLLIP